MEQVGTAAAEYVDCDFSRARLSGVNFWQSSLIRCRFAGRLAGVIFDGRDLREPKPPNPMLDVDFSTVTFDHCDFRGVNFDRVRLPDDPDIFVFRDPGPLRTAIAAMAADADPDTQSVGRVIGQILDRNYPGHTLINVRNLGRRAEVYRAFLTSI
jgi:Pentapeptide repeats (9 copies)